MTLFKARCLMTLRQRELLDAQYADLLSFRRELAAMNAAQRKACAEELRSVAVDMRQKVLLDLAGLIACMAATVLTLIAAMSDRSSLALLAACLMPIGASRLLPVYAFMRDTYFGTLRQLREIDMPPEPSRFDT